MMFRFGMIAVVLALGGCGGAPEQAAEDGGAANLPALVPQPERAEPVANATAIPAKKEARSCEAELGAKAAQALADQCRAVSPATRPPCNIANSCAMIREEIARSCDLFADDPPAECGNRPDDQRAADVVTRYYEAIDARDYATAYGLWGGAGEASGKRPGDFADGFATTRASRVRFTGPVTVEGAAGSLYAEVPVEVTATLDDGHRQKFIGSYVLRRVNDVDGATPEQLRWHIDSAKLRAA